MSKIDQDKKAKEYRLYREECGIKDPVMLDEIEEAYYQGMLAQEELIKFAKAKKVQLKVAD